MIVLKGRLLEASEEFNEPFVKIESHPNGYKIQHVNSANGPDLTITPDDIPQWGRKVFYWSAYGDGFISPSFYDDSRDADAFFKSRYGAQNAVLVVAKGDSDNLAVVVVGPVMTDLPHLLYNQYGPAVNAVEQVIPGFSTSKPVLANKAKRDLLEKINPMDKLSELEKQVDLLSALVISLIDNQPPNTRPNWYGKFKSMLNQDGAVNKKGADIAINEIKSGKVKIRALQDVYFSVKDAP